jgi:predicted nucleic acid-binding protein
MTKKKTLDVKIIIPDASPILTLARVGRLDLLQLFAVPIHIVDQVHYEVTKPENDVQGRVADMFRSQWLKRRTHDAG